MRTRASIFRVTVASLALGVGLAGCGGGGDDDPVPQPPPPPVSVDLPTNSVTVAGVSRPYSYYLPSNFDALKEKNIKDLRVVVSLHDAGETAGQNAGRTRWHEVAEEKGFVVIYPHAHEGVWNTRLAEARPDDVAYVHAAWSDIRTKFNVSDTNGVYMTGFGAGASMASQLAMLAPVIGYMPPIAGVAAIDGVADPVVFQLPKTQLVIPDVPEVTKVSTDTPIGRSLPPTAMPVWLITRDNTTNVTQQADYWKQQNEVAPTPVTRTDAVFSSTIFQNAENPLQEVRLSTFADRNVSGKDLSLHLWDNMFRDVIRFKNDDRRNGALVAFKTDEQLGLIDETVRFSEAARGERRFLTYVPSNYDELVARNGSVPLMFNFHGIRGSGWWQAINTDYVQAAEKHGFIAVFPQGIGAVFNADIAPNVSSVNYDVQFTLELVDWLKARYRVDGTRVFVGGVSAGSRFTNRLIVEYPDRFAGAALCYSGHLATDVYRNYAAYPQVRTDVPIPVWQCRGGTEGPMTFPGGEAGQEAARHFWRVVVNGHAPSATEEAAVPTATFTAGPEDRRHIKYFSGGKADYAWSTADFVPHFWHPGGQADLMWTQMFSHYSRNPDGSLTYRP